MPIVEITLIEGRAPEAKVRLIRQVSDAVADAIAAPLDSVRVILREVPATHFGAGGEPKQLPPGVGPRG